jgi:chromosome segregation ATPase
MRKSLVVAAVFSLGCIFVGSSITLALSQGAPSESSNTAQTEAAKTEAATKLKQRSEERKNRLKIRLDNAQAQRLSAKCGAAQGKLNYQVARFENSDKPYRAKYDNYIQKLEKLQARLKQNNIDTAKLEGEIAILKQKNQVLKTAVDQFVLAVNDAKAIDCKNDPTGFRAALDEAKTAGTNLKAARIDLEKYARETIKATIEELKAQRKSTQEQR